LPEVELLRPPYLTSLFARLRSACMSRLTGSPIITCTTRLQLQTACAPAFPFRAASVAAQQGRIVTGGIGLW